MNKLTKVCIIGLVIVIGAAVASNLLEKKESADQSQKLLKQIQFDRSVIKRSKAD